MSSIGIAARRASGPRCIQIGTQGVLVGIVSTPLDLADHKRFDTTVVDGLVPEVNSSISTDFEPSAGRNPITDHATIGLLRDGFDGAVEMSPRVQT